MDRKDYVFPWATPVLMVGEEGLLVSSGADVFHEGGGGYYGNDDVNDNPFVY